MQEFTIEAAASNLGVAPSTIRRRMAAGELRPGSRPGTVLIQPVQPVPPHNDEIVAALRGLYISAGQLRGPISMNGMGNAVVSGDSLREWLQAQGALG